MIIVDRALQAREEIHSPIRVGMIGAGCMGRGIANQIVNSVPGMRLAAIANRNVSGARRVYLEAGVEDVEIVESIPEINHAISRGKCAVTDDAQLLCGADEIDVLIEVTGTVEFGAQAVTTAIAHGKHVITMNAELDGTLGPILKVHADRAGVVLSSCDGDQPGVEMNLYRFVKGLGLTPLLCGNVKGLHDPYRNPTTQEGFAQRWGQRPSMVTSFADGTKISFEQAIVANGTGMRVAKRGMLGYTFSGHVDEATKLYDVDHLRALGGIVDYVVGAKPAPGVFVFATHDDPKQRQYLQLYKMGDGPLYSFYTPYHLCHFEVPNSLARAVLFHDATLTPKGGPCVDVITAAKTDLKAGTVLDGLGCYMTYGLCENSDVVYSQRLLPIGLAEKCRLKRDVKRDELLGYSDVDLPVGRISDRLRAEQDAHFMRNAAHPTAATA